MELTNTQKMLIKILIGVLAGLLLIGLFLIAYNIVKNHDKKIIEDTLKEKAIKEEETENETEDFDLLDEVFNFENENIMYEEGRGDLAINSQKLLDTIEQVAEGEISVGLSAPQDSEVVVYDKSKTASLGLGTTFDTNKEFFISNSLDVVELFNHNYIVFKYNSDGNEEQEYVVFYYPDDSMSQEMYFDLNTRDYSLYSQNCVYKVKELGGAKILWVKGL